MVLVKALSHIQNLIPDTQYCLYVSSGNGLLKAVYTILGRKIWRGVSRNGGGLFNETLP